MLLCVLLLVLVSHHSLFVSAGLYEPERVAEYHRRNHTWPPLDEDFIPNTDGWRKIMRRRMEQVQRIEDTDDMYNGE